MENRLKQKRLTTGLPVINQQAAGIDIGDGKHDIAIGQSDGSHLVLECPAFTEDLERLVARLVAEGIQTVAMESTGVYWLNLYLLLEEAGLLMISAILNGERNPQVLLQYKDGRIKASDEQILKSLKGIWKEEYLFTLQQAYDSYRFYQQQLKKCEEKIKALLLEKTAKILEGDITGLDIDKKKPGEKNNCHLMLK